MSLIPRDRLNAMLYAVGPPRDDDGGKPQRIPYPTAAQVLYAGPNPDGTRKSCGNCWKFVVAGRCLDVSGEINIGQVCGLHVFGKAQTSELQAFTLVGDNGTPVAKMLPAEAGLIDTPGGEGTSCDLCRFYTPDNEDSGLCEAVGGADGLPPVIVDARGCCARWELSPVR